MNNQEITDIFLKAHGKVRTAGRSDTMMALLPYLMMDACYELYCKEIKPLPLRFEAKKWRNVWSEQYHKFNQDFFRSFNADQQDFIIDKMDGFWEHIKNHVVILKMALVSGFRGIGMDESKVYVIATALACNTLAQSAQVIWNHMYLDSFKRPEVNLFIQGVEKATLQFANAYHHNPVRVNINKFPNVVEAMNVLCRYMIDWVKVDLEEQEEEL